MKNLYKNEVKYFDIIKKGTDIEVLSIDGVKALVKPLNSNEIISSKI